MKKEKKTFWVGWAGAALIRGSGGFPCDSRRARPVGLPGASFLSSPLLLLSCTPSCTYAKCACVCVAPPSTESRLSLRASMTAAVTPEWSPAGSVIRFATPAD